LQRSDEFPHPRAGRSRGAPASALDFAAFGQTPFRHGTSRAAARWSRVGSRNSGTSRDPAELRFDSGGKSHAALCHTGTTQGRRKAGQKRSLGILTYMGGPVERLGAAARASLGRGTCVQA